MENISWLSAILIGLFQGLTEFLPVSSSGHIMILNEWLNMDLQGGALQLFTILLHVGTLLAVLIMYRKTILDMIRHPIASDFKWLVVATIPTVIYALLMKVTGIEDALNGMARTLLPWMFFLTGIFLFLADKIARYRAAAKNTHKHVRCRDAVAMGLMQCIGTFAGVSRSGSTITGGLATGLNRKKVADFSFLMSIPAILGAVLLDVLDLESATVSALSQSIGPVIAGIVVAMISGLVAIEFMLYMIRKIRLSWFSVYVGVLGAVILIMDLVK